MLLLSSNCFSRPSWEQKFLFVFFLFAMRQVTMFCWTLVIWAFVCNETHRLCRCQQKKPTKDPVNKRCFSPLFPVFWERRKGNTFWLIDYVHVHSFFAESTFHLVFFQKRVVEISIKAGRDPLNTNRIQYLCWLEKEEEKKKLGSKEMWNLEDI